MKQGAHPKYMKCDVICNCGENRGVIFTTRSTVPQIKVEICSLCHPYYTGKHKLMDSAGRVEKFNKKYAKKKTIEPAEKTIEPKE
jgi:large subunit ribosomal protein L31